MIAPCYRFSGGELSCPAIYVDLNGSFSQSAGTNTVAGDLAIGGTSHIFSGGLLLTSNTDISSATWGFPGSSELNAFFQQSGGEHHVSNTLWNEDFYSMSGGSLYASNIVLAGCLSVSNQAVILNPGLFQLAGRLQLYGGTSESLGQLQLTRNSNGPVFVSCSSLFTASAGVVPPTPGVVRLHDPEPQPSHDSHLSPEVDYPRTTIRKSLPLAGPFPPSA